jgi:hypothetical protein
MFCIRLNFQYNSSQINPVMHWKYCKYKCVFTNTDIRMYLDICNIISLNKLLFLMVIASAITSNFAEVSKYLPIVSLLKACIMQYFLILIKTRTNLKQNED